MGLRWVASTADTGLIGPGSGGKRGATGMHALPCRDTTSSGPASRAGRALPAPDFLAWAESGRGGCTLGLGPPLPAEAGGLECAGTETDAHACMSEQRHKKVECASS